MSLILVAEIFSLFGTTEKLFKDHNGENIFYS